MLFTNHLFFLKDANPRLSRLWGHEDNRSAEPVLTSLFLYGDRTFLIKELGVIPAVGRWPAAAEAITPCAYEGEISGTSTTAATMHDMQEKKGGGAIKETKGGRRYKGNKKEVKYKVESRREEC